MLIYILLKLIKLHNYHSLQNQQQQQQILIQIQIQTQMQLI